MINIQNILITTLLLLSHSLIAKTLPVSSEDITRISSPPGIELFSGLIKEGNNNTLIYEHWDGHYIKQGHLMSSDIFISKSDLKNSHPVKLSSISDRKIVTLTGSFKLKNKNWIYYWEGDRFSKMGNMSRVEFKNGTTANKQKINLPSQLPANSFPHIIKLSSEKLIVIYLNHNKDKCCYVEISFSEDGTTFEAPKGLYIQGALPNIAEFADDTLIATYQNTISNAEKTKSFMASKYMLSHNDGNYWSKHGRVTDTVFEVHDTFPISRLDGNVDLYYSRLPPNSKNLTLWRRCVTSKGHLGKEELVITPSFGSIAKASPHRLSNGQILLSFVEQGEDVLKGEHSLYLTVIDKDSADCQFLSFLDLSSGDVVN